jgi:hypothetical protein
MKSLLLASAAGICCAIADSRMPARRGHSNAISGNESSTHSRSKQRLHERQCCLLIMYNVSAGCVCTSSRLTRHSYINAPDAPEMRSIVSSTTARFSVLSVSFPFRTYYALFTLQMFPGPGQWLMKDAGEQNDNRCEQLSDIRSLTNSPTPEFAHHAEVFKRKATIYVIYMCRPATHLPSAASSAPTNKQPHVEGRHLARYLKLFTTNPKRPR